MITSRTASIRFDNLRKKREARASRIVEFAFKSSCGEGPWVDRIDEFHGDDAFVRDENCSRAEGVGRAPFHQKKVFGRHEPAERDFVRRSWLRPLLDVKFPAASVEIFRAWRISIPIRRSLDSTTRSVDLLAPRPTEQTLQFEFLNRSQHFLQFLEAGIFEFSHDSLRQVQIDCLLERLGRRRFIMSC